jgi:hypothetical protein
MDATSRNGSFASRRNRYTADLNACGCDRSSTCAWVSPENHGVWPVYLHKVLRRCSDHLYTYTGQIPMFSPDLFVVKADTIGSGQMGHDFTSAAMCGRHRCSGFSGDLVCRHSPLP